MGMGECSMKNPNRIRRRLRLLLASVSVVILLLTVLTNGSFYVVGTCLLAGCVAAFFLLHALLCRCPHCGRGLPLSGDEARNCQHCGGELPSSHTWGTYSGLYYHE